MIREKIKSILEESTTNCHPSRHNEEYIKRLVKCVEILSDRVDHLEGLTSRSTVKMRTGRKPK